MGIQRFVNTIDITPSELKPIIRWAYRTKKPMFVWGTPGLGKTSIVHQLCEEDGLGCITKMLSQVGLGELSGLPYIEGRVSHYAPFDWLPTDPDWKGIIFLDELAEADDRLRAPAYELINERRISGCNYRLPEGALVIGAGNPPEDGSLFGEMSPAMADRFCHIYVKASVDDTLKLGLERDWAGEVLGYLKYQPGNLDGQLVDGMKELLIKPSCRSWERVSDVVKDPLLTTSQKQPMIFGYLGDAVASDFMYVLTCLDKLPSIPELFKMKMTEVKKVLPENLSSLYAVVYNCVQYVDKKDQLGQLIRIFKLIGTELKGKQGAELQQVGMELFMEKISKNPEYKSLVSEVLTLPEFIEYMEGDGQKAFA